MPSEHLLPLHYPAPSYLLVEYLCFHIGTISRGWHGVSVSSGVCTAGNVVVGAVELRCLWSSDTSMMEIIP